MDSREEPTLNDYERDLQKSGTRHYNHKNTYNKEDTASLASTAVNYDARSVKKLHIAAEKTPIEHPVERPAEFARTIMLKGKYPDEDDMADDCAVPYELEGPYAPGSPRRHQTQPPFGAAIHPPENKRKMSPNMQDMPRKVPRDRSPTRYATGPMDLSTKPKHEKVQSWLNSMDNVPVGQRALPETIRRPPSVEGYTAIHHSYGLESPPAIHLNEDKALFVKGSNLQRNTSSCPPTTREGLSPKEVSNSNSFTSYLPSNITDSMDSGDVTYSRAATAKADERSPVDALTSQLHGR